MITRVLTFNHRVNSKDRKQALSPVQFEEKHRKAT